MNLISVRRTAVCSRPDTQPRVVARRRWWLGACSLVLFMAPTAAYGQSSSQASATGGGGDGQPSPTEIVKELEAMKQRIAELEAEVKSLKSQTNSAPSGAQVPPAPAETANASYASAAPAGTAAPADFKNLPASAFPQGASEKPRKIDPFSDADWTWLNGNPRTKDIYWDSKFFTPEIRADVVYVSDFNHPTDHSMGGSSELFRTQEVQLEQLGVGGDFHYDNVRARLMTQFGMYSATTPRNDPSPGHGQWDLDTAYRYLTEAYGGYHFNALDGVNVDAGIFLSYIGLFSYYNFDNWAYQPSYVSSNTPWFFNGVRVQIFPNATSEDRAVVHQWMAILRFGKSSARAGRSDQMDSEALDEHHLQQLRFGSG